MGYFFIFFNCCTIKHKVKYIAKKCWQTLLCITKTATLGFGQVHGQIGLKFSGYVNGIALYVVLYHAPVKIFSHKMAKFILHSSEKQPLFVHACKWSDWSINVHRSVNLFYQLSCLAVRPLWSVLTWSGHLQKSVTVSKNMSRTFLAHSSMRL